MDLTGKFKKYILYSICFHALIFIILLLWAERERVPPPQVAQVTMLRIRGGPPRPVAPPSVKKKEPPPPEAPPPPKVTEPKPPEKPKTPPKPVKKKPEVRIGKPKKTITPKTEKVEAPDEQKITEALGQIDEQLQERERQLREPPPGPPTGVPGGAVDGSPDGIIAAKDPGYVQYQSKVRAKIMRQWIQTHVGGETQRLRARIKVRINASGTVISKTFARRSGVPSFDNSTIRAVERASPFPPPPPLVKAEALQEGFIVDFSSRVLGNR